MLGTIHILGKSITQATHRPNIDVNLERVVYAPFGVDDSAESDVVMVLKHSRRLVSIVAMIDTRIPVGKHCFITTADI